MRKDRRSGRSYEHRKQWVVDKIKELSSLFAIDVCAYAIMSSHYDAVLHVDEQRSLEWDDEEVVERWKRLFRAVLLVDRYMAGQCGTDAEADKALEVIGQWGGGCRMSVGTCAVSTSTSPRFWEGRFKSQALLACMAYVDLNPIRAEPSETLEGSDYTSIQQRIQAYVQNREDQPEAVETPSLLPESAPAVPTEPGMEQENGESVVPAAPLVEFTGTIGETESGLPFHFSDYLELADWTGRAIRANKRGHIPTDVPPILTRLGVEAENWIETVRHFRRHYYDFVGTADILAQCSRAMGRRWLRGVGACRKL